MHIVCYSCNAVGCKNCIRTVCSDCDVQMCISCRNNDDILCGCYGSCAECGRDVNRGEDGWPCNECNTWLCSDCQIKDNNICKECGNNEN